MEPEVEDETDDEAPASAGGIAAAPVYRPPEVDTPEPETEGVNHALHAVRTDVATRGLIRALADDPGVAFTALIARLFNQLPGRSMSSSEGSPKRRFSGAMSRSRRWTSGRLRVDATWKGVATTATAVERDMRALLP